MTRPIGVVRADWERWRAASTPGTDYARLYRVLVLDVPALLDRIEELTEQRNAVLAFLSSPNSHRYTVSKDAIRAALGVSGTREDSG